MVIKEKKLNSLVYLNYKYKNDSYMSVVALKWSLSMVENAWPSLLRNSRASLKIEK